jgi:maltoporin
MGALGNAINFAGADFGKEDALKAKFVDNLSIRPMPELGVSILVQGQHDENNTAGARENNTAGARRNWMSFGGRLTYDVSKFVAVMIEAGYDMTKLHGVDSKSLIKVTPAIELATNKSGSNPHMRLYATYASWSDTAAATNVAGENSAFTAGIMGEAGF